MRPMQVVVSILLAVTKGNLLLFVFRRSGVSLRVWYQLLFTRRDTTGPRDARVDIRFWVRDIEGLSSVVGVR